ncbi:interferon-induced GTP-binding protein Mx-like isoform X2 [Engraulis encrasicolus]|uniref:interferon-induced GTP-binding protein Mx-like isoform X2 n=1 Tax=Engraulis encrasicolus TaxID=184585 RepID=UPI002FD1A941
MGDSSYLNQHYEEHVRSRIDLVNSLMSLGVEQDLSLPAIAVIGDQSSGKSSVLEALSGVALPRGTGIVTRCPLVLQLKRASHGTAWSGRLSYQGYEVGLEKPEDVGDEVIEAQNTLAGEGHDISDKKINLEIFASNVPDLTLIDLPGIARVATGNQSDNIDEKIKKLILQYIKQQETIILVVVPANVDIATTEALRMAKTVDPEGQRTLGILTKPDLVDKGAEEGVVKTLNNQAIRLEKGYMVVRCRGQKDITDGMSLDKSLQKEREFFSNHMNFRIFLDERKASIPHLSEKLTKELVYHIGRSIPLLERQVIDKLEQTSTQLKLLGDRIPEDEAGRVKFLTGKILEFTQVLTNVVRAEEDLEDSDTRVFTKIRNLFKVWKAELDEKDKRLKRKMDAAAMKEYAEQHRGKELPGFLNYRIFEDLVKGHVKELEVPALDLLRCCKVRINLEKLRDQEYKRAEKKLKSQFAMEKMVYSEDGLYIEKFLVVKSETEADKKSNSKDSDFDGTTQHLRAYLKITTDRLVNQVPLIVLHHMLDQYIGQMKEAMLGILTHKKFEKFTEERSDVAQERKNLRSRMERLEEARQALNSFVPV